MVGKGGTVLDKDMMCVGIEMDEVAERYGEDERKQSSKQASKPRDTAHRTPQTAVAERGLPLI